MKKLIYRHTSCSVLITLLLLLCACSTEKTNEQQTASITIEDDLGRKIQLPHQPQRVLALASSMTEMLFAVCDTASIVGRTQNCDYPAAALSKPVVNNYPVDMERVLQLKPDLIFTTEGITPLEVAARLEELGVPVYYQKYRTVEDIFSGLEDIGRIVGREQQAKQVADSLRQEVAQIEARHKNKEQPLKVLAVVNYDPIYVYGHSTVISDKLRILGAENAVEETYEAMSREAILKSNPDVLLGGTPEEMEKNFFSIYPELRKIKAYQNKRIYKPTADLMSRATPRVVASIKELERFLYPS
ncbi:ABC transporter substrate-binding protein [Pontibacter harenae]|uniref:ABC transporter substrate-binding protein n=1 Tax=Pontibacter harenae TaxID=2894083 RepID=UPI001E560702|nr:ABC transporter substrate-binding protein [Pontibacter harenae]MCC9166138.1 ABC transporter substrate-binding protein [Pontibacter harenae]